MFVKLFIVRSVFLVSELVTKDSFSLIYPPNPNIADKAFGLKISFLIVYFSLKFTSKFIGLPLIFVKLLFV